MMTRGVLTFLLAACVAMADDVSDLAARIEMLSSLEPAIARADTLQRTAKMLEPTRPDLSAHLRALASCVSGPGVQRPFPLPKFVEDAAVVERLVEEVEHSGDDPSAYDALAGVIRANQFSAGLDNPSIRARIALADLDELLDPILTGLDGTQVRLNRYRSKTIELAFWATWCVPCRDELARLEKVASPDHVILAVSWEPRETVAAFVQAHPYHLPMFIDAGHKLGDRFHIDTLPATVKLDALP